MIDEREIRRFFNSNPSLSDVDRMIKENPAILTQKYGDGRREFNIISLAVGSLRADLLTLLFESGVMPIEGQGCSENLIDTLFFACAHSYEQKKINNSVELLRILVKEGVMFPVADHESCRDFIKHRMFRAIAKCEGLFHAMIELGFNVVDAERIAKISMVSKALEERDDKVNKICDELLSLGCSANPLEGDSFSSPVASALQYQRYDLAARLLDAGGVIHEPSSAAFLLAECQGVPVSILDRILDKNNISPHEDRYGKSPLHVAIQFRNFDFISYVANLGVDINFPSTECGTPLVYAVNNKCKDSINLLLSLGADINAIDDKKRTPLDLAQSLAGMKKICDFLIKAGAKTRVELAGIHNSLDGLHEAIKRAILPGDIWAEKALSYLLKTERDEAEAWHALIRHCLDSDSAKPTTKWSKEATRILSCLDGNRVRKCLVEWMQIFPDGRSQQGIIEDREFCSYERSHSEESNIRLMKGFIWLASRYSDDEISRALRDLSCEMYKKVRGVGMRNAKIANAALYSLSVMPKDAGIKEIISLRSSTKYNPALVNINRVFDRLAKEKGKTPDELAEQMVPDYGLSDIGILRKRIGKYEARVQVISPGKCDLSWSVDGKIRSSVPSDVLRDNAGDVKVLKDLVKDLKLASLAHCYRIEQMYLRKGSIDYGVWMEQYIDHKLIGVLSRKLIWHINDGGSASDVIFLNGAFVDNSGAEVNISHASHVTLWHPIFSEPQSVIAWRKFLLDREITQPFKQAHREIYLLTDAERKADYYSLRFSDHILKMTQFHALATQRGWKQNRGGHWDGGSDNWATKNIPAFGVGAYFHAEGAESYGFGSGGMYECVATGRLSFYVDDEDVKLDSIDPLVRSEVMRDIDLFVGVASVGNDPNWRDRTNPYWERASFGELSETASTRADVLMEIIPKLAISEKLSIDGKWLLVRGSLSTYKIHLGSSNIRIALNDAYLCIVEAKSKSNLMLPFEGDHTLSLIISKAALLANDHKIKDESILSQIPVAQ